MNDSVQVRVPGSTSNLGPGFDCLGLALNLYNVVRVTRAEEGGEMCSPAHEMVKECAEVFFRKAGQERFAFGWEISGEVPMSRGLGSSVTLRLGVLFGLNRLCGDPLNRERLFSLCSDLEGHPDNASAAAFGGFVVANQAGKWMRFRVREELCFVLLVPDEQVETEKSREVLPRKILLGDAALNIANTALLVASFAKEDYSALRGCFKDLLHQEQRGALNRGLFQAIKAGEEAGAFGGFLSGSGSTIACICSEDHAKEVKNAMGRAYKNIGVSFNCLIVHADNDGAVYLE